MRSRASAVLPPSKLRERRLRARRIKISLFVAAFFLIGAGAIGFFYIPALAVRDVRIEGVVSLPSADLEREVREELSGRAFLVLPKRNAFVYSGEAMERRLKLAYPKLSSVSVSLDTFHAVRVTVSERKPYALYCDSVGEESPAPCLFLDALGVAYEQAPEFSDNAYVRWYGGEALRAGSQYFSEDIFRKLSALVEAFEDEGIVPVSVEIDEVRDVSVRDTSGSEILFELERKPEDVLKALRAARASDVLSGREMTEIEYIDLRFGNRLYYKLR